MTPTLIDLEWRLTVKLFLAWHLAQLAHVPCGFRRQLHENNVRGKKGSLWTLLSANIRFLQILAGVL